MVIFKQKKIVFICFFQTEITARNNYNKNVPKFRDIFIICKFLERFIEPEHHHLQLPLFQPYQIFYCHYPV